MANGTVVCNCGDCEASYKLVDGGTPEAPLALDDVSAPRIDSINVSAGPITGGTVVFIQGTALDVGALVVKFGGLSAPTVDQRTATSARVVTPNATLRLNVVETCARLTLAPMLGLLSEGESFTANDGSTGTIVLTTSTHYVATFATLVDGLAALVGTNIVGSSGAIATVTAANAPSLTPGEAINGSTSATVATVATTGSLSVTSPTGGFAPGELIIGSASGAVLKLDPVAPYTGEVDVSVENEYGRRQTGSTLVGAFTYE
jgi:hypothetical protein